MNRMRKLLLLLLIMMSTVSASAVESRSVGSNTDFYAYTFDGKYYLILTFKDDNKYRLTHFSIVKFVLNDGTIIRLEGINASSSSDISSTSFYNGFGSFTIGDTDERHYAILSITEDYIKANDESRAASSRVYRSVGIGGIVVGVVTLGA